MQKYFCLYDNPEQPFIDLLSLSRPPFQDPWHAWIDQIPPLPKSLLDSGKISPQLLQLRYQSLSNILTSLQSQRPFAQVIARDDLDACFSLNWSKLEPKKYFQRLAYFSDEKSRAVSQHPSSVILLDLAVILDPPSVYLDFTDFFSHEPPSSQITLYRLLWQSFNQVILWRCTSLMLPFLKMLDTFYKPLKEPPLIKDLFAVSAEYILLTEQTLLISNLLKENRLHNINALQNLFILPATENKVPHHSEKSERLS